MYRYLQKVKSKKTYFGNKNLFFVGILSATDEKKQEPDTYVSGTDPRIRIRT